MQDCGIEVVVRHRICLGDEWAVVKMRCSGSNHVRARSTRDERGTVRLGKKLHYQHVVIKTEPHSMSDETGSISQLFPFRLVLPLLPLCELILLFVTVKVQIVDRGLVSAQSISKYTLAHLITSAKLIPLLPLPGKSFRVVDSGASEAVVGTPVFADSPFGVCYNCEGDTHGFGVSGGQGTEVWEVPILAPGIDYITAGTVVDCDGTDTGLSMGL